MKHCTFLAFSLLTLLLVTANTTARTASTSDEQDTELKQMAAEIKRLRLEIIEQAIEFQAWKLKQLDRELLAIQSEQQRLREMESSIQQQLIGLVPQAIHDPAAGAVQMDELEIVKATHIEDGLKPLQLKQQPLAEREAQLREEINRENTRLQELQRRKTRVEN